MGINNEGIINRRQLLVKAGSLMKLSWRKSREKLIDVTEDHGDDNSNLRKSGKSQKRNLSVRFSSELYTVLNSRVEIITDEEIENTWYQSADYCRFKKDTILNSMNYINARRASKPFDETKNCIWGIEDMCILDRAVSKRYAAEKRRVYKAIRDEQSRQKKEFQQQQQQSKNSDVNKRTCPSPNFDMNKLRSVSVCHTKGGRDRALARGNEYARAQQRSLGLGATRNTSSSMKNLFLSFRTQSNRDLFGKNSTERHE